MRFLCPTCRRLLLIDIDRGSSVSMACPRCEAVWRVFGTSGDPLWACLRQAPYHEDAPWNLSDFGDKPGDESLAEFYWKTVLVDGRSVR